MKFIILIIISLILNDTLSAADSQPVKIGLALSGGAALGLAHIGVLKVFEREGIPVCCISGNSMGAMVGGIYAAGFSAVQIESIAVNANWPQLFSSTVSFGAQYLPERQLSQRYSVELRHRNFLPSLPSSLVSLQYVEFLLMQLLAEIEYNTYYDFDSLQIPYKAVAVDLISGERIVLEKGRLSRAIRASIAIPAVFPPERMNGQELVDGGVQQYLPVDPLYEYEPDLIIAVITMKRRTDTGIALIDIVSRSMDLVNIEDLWLQRNLADIVIEPDVDPYNHSDFAKAKELIKAGETAAESLLPQIRAKLGDRPVYKPSRTFRKRPLPVLRSMRIEGLKITHESMLHYAIHTKPGELLQFKTLIGDLIRIYNLGLFESVDYSIEPISADSVDLVIEVEEKAYGFYSLGIRYDNIDNVNIGLEVGQGNLGGSGASIRAAFMLGNPNEYRLGITGTRLFWLPFGYRLDAFWGQVEYPYYDQDSIQGLQYLLTYRGGVAEAGYILGKNAFFNIGMKAHQVLYEIPPVAVFDTLILSDWIIGPKFNLEFNDLNDLYLPTEGLVYRLSAFYSSEKIAATNDFIKINFTLERVKPMTAWLLYRAGLDVGTIIGKPSWSEYFHNGGENFVGFVEDEFTTKQRAVVDLGFDLRLFRLFEREDYPVYLQLFSNIGSFEPIDTFFSGVEPMSLMDWGIGAGLKTNTPIGPLRFNFGIGDLGKEDKNTRFNFTFIVGRDFRYTH